MALNDILEAIRLEATAEAAELRSKGKREAESILAQAARAAEQRLTEISTAREEETADAARVVRNRAQLEVNRRLRRAREAVYESALAEVKTRLAAIRDNAHYPQVFTDLVEESRQALPEGRILRVDPRDLELAERAADRETRLKVETSLSTWGGVELWTDDGRRVLNTIEARLERAGPQLRQTFARLVAPITGGLE